MHLIDGESAYDDWAAVDGQELRAFVHDRLPEGRSVVRVDGRSGAGKSTLGARIARLFDAPLVHVDDLSWHVHPIHWADLMTEHVVDPWLDGKEIRHRPAAWIEHGRPGAIVVPSGRLLVVEGVGAGRAELDHAPGLLVWVQTDYPTAKQRGLDRDVREGRPRPEAEAFWEEWEQEERPFLAQETPWARADFAVNGTPPAGTPVGVTLVSTTRA